MTPNPGDQLLKEIGVSFPGATLVEGDPGPRWWQTVAMGAHGALQVRDVPEAQNITPAGEVGGEGDR